MANKRYRDFATVVYPDSAPENWLDILKEQKIQALVSPLHDSDLNADNTPKKAHYHVYIMFEGCKTKEQAVAIFSQIGGVGCEVVNSRRGMARYLTHEDNPEKHKYSKDEVIQIGGVDYFEIINLPSDKYALIGDILDFVIDNRYTNIIDLFRYAREQGLYDWYRVIVDNTYIFDCYTKAVRNKKIDIMK